MGKKKKTTVKIKKKRKVSRTKKGSKNVLSPTLWRKETLKKVYAKGYLISANKTSRAETALHQVLHEKTSIQRAARQNSLSYGYLYRRICGGVSIESRNGPDPIFSSEEERALARWLTEMTKRGMDLSPGEFLAFVESVLKKEKRTFKNDRPSYTWYYSFMSRNSDIVQRKQRIPRMTPKQRAAKWLENYYEFVSNLELSDKPHRIWSADETGFELGARSGHVIDPAWSDDSDSHSPQASEGPTKPRLTVMYCGNADGELMPPFFVFPMPRPTLYDPMVGSARGSVVHYTKKGLMGEDTFMKFLDHFDRNAGTERPVILLIDSTYCNLDVNTFDYAVARGIEIYRYGPNTLHPMKPLDAGIFGPLKRKWKKTVKRHNKAHPRKPIVKATFPAKLHETVDAFFKPLTLINGFTSGGLYPISHRAVSKIKKTECVIETSIVKQESDTSIEESSDTLQQITETLCLVCKVSFECNVQMGDNAVWIQCDACHKWMHQNCLPSSFEFDIKTLMEDRTAQFICHECAE